MKRLFTFMTFTSLTIACLLATNSPADIDKDRGPGTSLSEMQNTVISKSVKLQTSLDDAPFTMGFEDDEDFTGWKFLDANQDAKTWEVRETGSNRDSKSIGYPYHSQNAANDWLFTPQFEFKAGVDYEIEFCYATEYQFFPEKMGLYYFDDDSVRIKDFGVVNNTSYIKYIDTISLDVTDSISIAWYCYSDANMGYLYIDSVSVRKISSGSTGSETPTSDEPTWTSYTTTTTGSNGLINNEVHCSLVDSEGGLWIGTDKGVTYKNGSVYTTYNEKDNYGLSDVRDIFEDNNGTVWVAAGYQSVFTIDADSIIKYDYSDGLSGYIYEIEQDASNKLYFVNYNSVYTFDGSAFSKLTTIPEGVGYDIDFDSQGNMWAINYENGIVKFDGTNTTNYTTTEGLQSNYCSGITVNGSEIWVNYSYGYGTSKFDGTTFTDYRKSSDGILSDYIRDIKSSSDGVVWFATSDGIMKYDGTSFTNIASDGMSDDDAKHICIKSSNEIYASTYSGLNLYDGNAFTIIGTQDGLVDNYVKAIGQDKDGNLYFGTYDYGLSIFDGQDWSWQGESTDNLPDDNIYCIFRDSKDILWIGTYDGLVKYDGTTWTTFDTNDGLAGDLIRGIGEDASGNIWLACNSKGISKYNGISFTNYQVPPSGTYIYYNSIATVGDNIYVGTDDDGIYYYDGSTWTIYTTDNSDLVDNEVRDAFVDSKGNVWFNHDYSSRITSFDGTSFTTYSTTDGLKSTSYHNFAEDKDENLWIASYGEGIAKFDGSVWTFFNEDSGLINNSVKTIFIDDKDNLWCGTYYGISKYEMGQSTTEGDTTTITPEKVWDEPTYTAYNTGEAEMIHRTGDIDNLGFGWPENFNLFSGTNTPSHSWPFTTELDDPAGTDKVLVVSSYDYSSSVATDGYVGATSRPDNIPVAIDLSYDLKSIAVQSIVIQMFVDDFQASVWGAQYTVTVDGTRIPELETIINSLQQTGPIGKLITMQLPTTYNYLFEDGAASILVDDATTGAGDGFGIDFVRILVNPNNYENTGTITGRVTEDGIGLIGVTVEAAGFVTATTDANGDYSLTNVPAGVILISASKTGYETTSALIDLSKDASEVKNLTIDKLDIKANFEATTATSGSAPINVSFSSLSTGTITDYTWDYGDGTRESISFMGFSSHTYTTPGTYDVKLVVANDVASDSMIIVDYVTVIAASASEVEPNNTYDVANILVLDVPKSGYLDTDDTEDWYAITADYDGEIMVVINPADTFNTGGYLMYEDGESLWTYLNTNGGEGENDTLFVDNAKAGTYYVRVLRQNYWDDGSYEISFMTNPTAIPNGNDLEPNDTYGAALTILADEVKTGHMGYANKAGLDDKDWYILTLPEDGKITLVVDPEERFNSSVSFFYEDGESYWSTCTSCGIEGENDTIVIDDIKAGTYYFYVDEHNYWDNGSYSVHYSFEAITLNNDLEPNDDSNSAIAIGFNETKTGHMGYKNKASDDSEDWYSVTLEEASDLNVIVSPSGLFDSYVSLFNTDGESYITNCTSCGEKGETDTLLAQELAPGTYFIKVSKANYWDKGSYSLTVSSVTAPTLSANFTADITSGESPLTVQFTDSSVNATSWKWDFDNDGIVDSEEQNPSYIYTIGGTYSVKLTVGDGTSIDYELKTDFVSIVEGTPGLALPFEEKFEYSDKVLPSHFMQINENNNNYEYSVSSIIDIEGDYSCAVYSGGYAAENWFILPKLALPADKDINFSFSVRKGEYGYAEGFEVLVSTTGTDKSDFTAISELTLVPSSYYSSDYTYDLSDYANSNCYIAIKHSSDEGYRFAIDDILVKASLVAEFTTDKVSGPSPLVVKFTDTSVDAVKWEWDFDNDGTVDSELQNPTYTYTEAGSYSVKLTINDGTESAEITKPAVISVINTLSQGWSKIRTTITTDLSDVVFPSTMVGYACGEGAVILKTTDGGQSWIPLNTGVTSVYGIEFYDIDFYDNDHGWAVGNKGIIVETKDGGVSWTKQSLSSMLAGITGIAALGENKAYACGLSGLIMEKGTSSWSWKSEGADFFNTIGFANESTGWIAGYAGGIFKTVNGSSTWTSQTIDTDASINHINVIDENIVIALGSGGQIFKTTNGGDNWTMLSDNDAYGSDGMHFVDEDNGWIVYSKKSLYTLDGGVSWNVFPTNSDNKLYDVNFTSKEAGCAVGEEGTVLLFRGNPETASLQENSIKSHINLYPNPATTQLTIEASSSLINELSIIDLNGAEVFYKSSVDASKTMVDISYLNHGIYMVKVVSNNSTYVEKLIIK